MSAAVEVTPQARRVERTILRTIIADLIYYVFMLIGLLASDSLTLLGEIFRGVLMSLFEMVSYFILININRQRWPQFVYGAAKLEQLCFVMLGSGIVLGGIWLSMQAAQKVTLDLPGDTAVGLAIAAIVLSINSLLNCVTYVAVRRVHARNPTPISEGQYLSRRTKMVSSTLVQFLITLAALTNDPLLARWLDVLGAGLVSVVMLRTGIQTIKKGMADLTDKPLPVELTSQLQEEVYRHIHPAFVSGLRARGAHEYLYVEAFVQHECFNSINDLNNRQSSLQEALGKVSQRPTTLQLRLVNTADKKLDLKLT